MQATHALVATDFGNPSNQSLAMTYAMAPDRQVLEIPPWFLIWYNFYLDTSCNFNVMGIFVFFSKVRGIGSATPNCGGGIFCATHPRPQLGDWFRDPLLRVES